MSGVVGIFLIALGLPGAVAAVHLTVLSVASLFFRETPQEGVGTRFLIIVPAHNEAAVIGDTVDSLVAAARPVCAFQPEDDLLR